jgi:hypothetical protein
VKFPAGFWTPSNNSNIRLLGVSKMHVQLGIQPLGSAAPVGEILLAETAIRIELPPSLHRLAVDRYEALRTYIERDGSSLAGLVRIFYPQGSMAIRATIRSRKREDGFDIDIVAELILPVTMPPAAVLDLLFAAINGEGGRSITARSSGTPAA